MVEQMNLNDDITGNAPMIPRSEVIAILNELQMLQTRCLILLSKYEPDHFKETKTRPHQAPPIVWAESSTGLPESEVVRTIT